MLGAGSHLLRLHAADVADGHSRRQEWVFAHILEIAPTKGRPLDIQAGSEQDVLAAMERFAPDRRAVSGSRFRIPGCGQRYQRWHAGGKIIRASRGIPCIRTNIFAHAVRAVRHPAAGNAQTRNGRGGEFGIPMEQRDFFLKGQPLQQVFDARFFGLSHIEVSRALFSALGRKGCERGCEREAK